MNKITIIVISSLLALAVVFVLLTQKPKNPASDSLLSPTKTVSPQIQLKTYNNASGFSFKYPESFALFEKGADDESIYAWVELTDSENKEAISVKLEDSDLEKIDDWFTASNKKDIKGKIGKVKLADLDGRQFITEEGQITTLALDEGGVLITISGNSSSVHQQIVSSFIFTQSTQNTSDTSGTSGDGGEDIIFEGEEVIE